MIDFTTTQCFLFPKMFAKPAVVQFDHRQGSSDGGAILLKSADSSYRLVPSLARCLEDNRQAWQGRSFVATVTGAARVLDCLRISGRQ